ncbi:hypothetical protein BCR32DRAFT_270136 [Anaeromyces robustus]|uniref:CBM1 domain-containing protein n=1 Tax=Anaeromyces robustus TaxID=1754192 RepID=A0A1Y1WYF8_9FUNG|nr:hypothetical protein BCR32DRAFT_270136 [Anaeromyces robustus]|eukprot:ORX78358.1 hypothetical protein BCR32DRAFT_270136 [Anaeromyces robustus]
MNSKIFFSLFSLFGVALAKKECWSEVHGYPCCELKTTQVEFTDSSTGEQYGIENGRICGINDIQFCPRGEKYKCCKSCDIFYVDNYKWGVENNEWCSIPFVCDSYNNTTIISTTPTTKTNKTSKTSKTSTISTISITTTTTTNIISTNEPDSTECSKEFEMCGGSLYPDSPECCEGTFCLKSNSKYHQCIPEYLREYFEEQMNSTTTHEPNETIITTTTVIITTTTTPSTTINKTTIPSTSDAKSTTTNVTIPTNDVECIKAYQQCGGLNYKGTISCCEEGYFCHKNDEHYHQCIPIYEGYENDDTQPNLQPNPSPISNPNPQESSSPKEFNNENIENCADFYQKCGADDEPKRCCVPGSKCVRLTQFHYQCMPDN